MIGLYEPTKKMAEAGVPSFRAYAEGATIKLYTELGAEFARFDFDHRPTRTEIDSYLSRFTDSEAVRTEGSRPVPVPRESPARSVVAEAVYERW
ncbi:MAG: hypothetical protein J4400_05600 [Candidatus Aenigmarchaeota archaeon]|nr:hypothetical protein [Candidatus Aenigmarchaeota archaeon]